MNGSKIFYGWFVVAACFMALLIDGGTFSAFGVFFKPLENEFGWSRTVVSSGYTAFLASHAISVIVSGRLVDRYAPRPVLLASALLTGSSVALCSQIQTVSQFRLFSFIVGLGLGPLWSIPNASVQRWFYRRPMAGLALSLSLAGVGVGALVFAPLLNHLILNLGWRNAFLVFGIISFATIAAVSPMIKPIPADIRTPSSGEKAAAQPVTAPGRSLSRLVTSPAFISLALVTCTTSAAFNLVNVHLIPLAIDAAISPTAAAAALGLMGGFSVPGRILAGFIADRIGWQRGLALAVSGTALSILWLLFLQATWMLYCFVLFFGIFWGLRSVAQSGIIGEFFGMGSLGMLIGINSAVANGAGAVAPYIAGFIFDVTGSYSSAFIIMLVILAIGGIIAITIKNPSINAKQPPLKVTAP